MLEDFKKLLSSHKILKIKIELVKGFPATLINDSSGSIKKSNKLLLNDVIFSEDLPALIDQIDAVVSRNTVSLYIHSRILVEHEYEWFLLSCELKKEKFARLPYLSGTILNVSHYLETVADDPVVKEYRIKNIGGILLTNSSSTSLVNILEPEYLVQIQMPFKYTPDIYSAIFNDKDELICTPVSDNDNFNLAEFKYSEKFNIRINHVTAGYWVIASNKDTAVKLHTPLLKVLATSVSRIANAYVMLFNEMTNSEQANKMLGENIEQQILINSVYNIVLEQRRSDVALNSVIKLVGEYIGIERISILYDNPVLRYLEMKYEWAVQEHFLNNQKKYSYDEIPKTIEKLEYTDLCYPQENVHDFTPFGTKHYAAVNLNGDRTRFAVIIFETITKDKAFTSNESKIIRSISQIIATLLMQYQIDLKLEETTERLRHLAFNDAILNLPNRAQLDQDLSKLLLSGTFGAVITLKLTNMRVFNELFGHAYTDKLLKSVACFVKDIPEESLKIYRFSGNMLMIVLKECNALHAKRLADKIQQRFKTSWEQENNNHYLEAGMGISIFPDNGKTCEEVYRAATLALYRAVEYGANSYTFYTKEFEKPATLDYYYSQKLRKSINEGMNGFNLTYQPIIDERTGAISMFEAFVSWNDGKEHLSTSKLMRLAENMGFDILLDNWVIETVCMFCKKQQELFPEFAVSVNATARELRSGTIVSMVQHALEKTSLDGKYLYIELPERAVASQSGSIIPTVSHLKGLGVNIVIDNFRSGFSSSYLLKYSYVDLIKVDFDLFNNVQDRFDEIFVDTAINLAKIIRYGICVKHIKNKEQLETIKKYNINLIQGRYYSKSLTECEITQYIVNTQSLGVLSKVN